jgi:hypothetical protein
MTKSGETNKRGHRKEGRDKQEGWYRQRADREEGKQPSGKHTMVHCTTKKDALQEKDNKGDKKAEKWKKNFHGLY